VTRNWSVQAAAFRSLDEAGPGRVYLGIGPGDSAVHSVGLKPASPKALADYVAEVCRHGPSTLPVMVAAGGPRSVAGAAAYCDHLVIGQGASLEAMTALGEIADASAREHERAEPAKWVFIILCLASSEADVGSARNDVKAAVVAYSRQAFDHTFEAKGVAPELQAPLRSLYARYSFEEHSAPGETANARLLASEEFAGIGDYLFSRFAVVGTPEVAADRLLQIAGETGIDRIFMTFICSDIVAMTRLAAERMLPRLPLETKALPRG
jgi:alkanesulfonate monooxygenase SsuD/methylene tetrahydromethanopterin reductase-like flavin-dependent oxidoreductase (luciferase family)